MNNTDITNPIIKASSAIAAAGATQVPAVQQVSAAATQSVGDPVVTAILALPWATLAQIGAAVYSLLLISEWFWKKFWRPLFERRGWLKPHPKRRVVVVQELGPDTEPGAQ